jgi:hypothetical protein
VSTCLTITVTAEDVRQGLREDSRHCPIALAVRKQLCSSVPAAVDVDDILTVRHSADHGGTYYLPPEAQDFIHRYDRELELPPMPFTFVATSRWPLKEEG